MDAGGALRSSVTEHLMAISPKYFGNTQDMTARFSRTGNGGLSCPLQ
jgi:hypothetical protein